MKSFTVRLEDTLADELALVAQVDRNPVAHAIRLAVAAYTHTRKSDPQWQGQLRALHDRYQKLGGQ